MAARKMEVLPAIDLLGNEAVRLRRGDYGHVLGYGSPTERAAEFAAAGARWIHVVDLDGARNGRLRPELVHSVVKSAAPARVQASGGVRKVADALALLGADVELVRRVTERSGLPVLAAGGIRSEADLEALAQAGAEGAIVGRALLEGSI